MVVEEFVLAEDDRIIDGHRFEQHRIASSTVAGSHHDEPGIMGVQRLHALAVKGSAARRPADGRRTMIGQGTSVRQYKVAAWLTIWLKPHAEKSANCISMIGRIPSIAAPIADADDGILADRRVEHPAGKFLGEILGGLEGAAESADVLPVNKTRGSSARALASAEQEWLPNR